MTSLSTNPNLRPISPGTMQDGIFLNATIAPNWHVLDDQTIEYHPATLSEKADLERRGERPCTLYVWLGEEGREGTVVVRPHDDVFRLHLQPARAPAPPKPSKVSWADMEDD